MNLSLNINILSRKRHQITESCSIFKYLIITRSMMSAKSGIVGLAIRGGLFALTNSDVTNHLNRNNHRSLAQSLANYSYSHTQGIAPHKTSFLHHIITHKFPIEDIAAPVVATLPMVKYIPGEVDARVFKELPVILHMVDNYGSSINTITFANDTPVSFPHQRQPNVDYWVDLKCNLNLSVSKLVPHDEKSGKGMFKHTTGGSVGLLYFDSMDQNIQVTELPLTLYDLVEYDLQRILRIPKRMVDDGLDIEPHKTMLAKHHALFTTVKKLPGINPNFQQVKKMHYDLQDDLWHHIQRNSKFQRSVSLIFIEQMLNIQLNNHEEAFHKNFVSRLGNKMYNLDNRQDAIDLLKAAMYAYRDTCDKDVFKKLCFLKDQGITFSNLFSSIFSQEWKITI